MRAIFSLGLSLVSTSSFAGGLPPDFNYANWQKLVAQTIAKGEVSQTVDGEMRSLSHIVPNDKTQPHQADYLTTAGAVESTAPNSNNHHLAGPLTPALPWKYPGLLSRLRHLHLNIYLPAAAAHVPALHRHLDGLVAALDRGRRLAALHVLVTTKSFTNNPSSPLSLESVSQTPHKHLYAPLLSSVPPINPPLHRLHYILPPCLPCFTP